MCSSAQPVRVVKVTTQRVGAAQAALTAATSPSLVIEERRSMPASTAISKRSDLLV